MFLLSHENCIAFFLAFVYFKWGNGEIAELDKKYIDRG